MKVIHKHYISIREDVTLSLPMGYKILKVDAQNSDVVMWVLADIDNEKIDVSFSVFGTGWVIPETVGEYIGTALCGALVWHVFKGES